MRRFRRFRGDERGASLLEMTLLTPVLIMLAAGVFEFGRLLYQHGLIETGVRDASRYLSRFSNPAPREADAIDLAINGRIGGSTKRVSWWNTGDIIITYSTVANPIDGATGERTYRGPDPIRVVRVTTTATYPGFGMLGVMGFGSGVTVGFYHEERVVGD